MNIVMILTEECNLNCTYCYVKDNPLKMSYETIDKTLEWSKSFIPTLKEDEHVLLNLFGGEALVAKNELKYIIEQTNLIEKEYPDKIKCTIYSNGILINDEILNFVDPYRHFVHFNFSLDGCKTAHDMCRVDHAGRGSFDRVLKGIRKYAQKYGSDRLSIRSMISPQNVPYLLESAEFMRTEGISRFGLSIIRDNIWSDEDLVLYEKELMKLADYFIEHIDEGLFYDIFAISLLDVKYSSRNYCSAGVTKFAVTPTGDIYPCQRFYNNRSPFKIGDVFNGIDENNRWTIFFKNYSAENFIACSKCKTFPAYNCTGQCIASMYDNGDMLKPIPGVCKLLKITYKVSLYVQEQLKDNSNYILMFNRNKFGG